jgi:membrane protease YdiL (CAAX protease family)
MTSGADRPAHRLRNVVELICVLMTGIGHVVLELCCDGMKGAAAGLNRPQHLFNLIAVVCWGAYLAWCLFKKVMTADNLGFRKEGFSKSMAVGLLFAVPGFVAMAAIGLVGGMVEGVSLGFWILIPLYPIWGLAQQFALQSLVARNLRGLLRRDAVIALSAGTIFSLAHFPNFMLMALTFPAGVFLTWLFSRYRNMWAVGVLHGILGAAAYYFVLGQDPGLDLLQWFSSMAG